MTDFNSIRPSRRSASGVAWLALAVAATLAPVVPVLAETGLIKPGKFVSYLDGSQARLGLVRSTSLAWSFPKLRQTIAVDTHP